MLAQQLLTEAANAGDIPKDKGRQRATVHPSNSLARSTSPRGPRQLRSSREQKKINMLPALTTLQLLQRPWDVDRNPNSKKKATRRGTKKIDDLGITGSSRFDAAPALVDIPVSISSLQYLVGARNKRTPYSTFVDQSKRAQDTLLTQGRDLTPTLQRQGLAQFYSSFPAAR